MEPPRRHREATLWNSLIPRIAEGSVIPIVGRDLLSISQGADAKVSLYSMYAAELAEALGVERETAEDASPLNAVAADYILGGGEPDEIYVQLAAIAERMNDVPIPDGLQKLAAIDKFSFFVSTTFDNLLERAVTAARSTPPTVLSYSAKSQPTNLPDLDAGSVIVHLFGRVSSLPNYVVTEEDALEFVFSLLSSRSQPAPLLHKLWRHDLLIVGCSFPAWSVRFLLRLMREKRLLFADRDKIVYVVDPGAKEDAGLQQFVKAFKTRTEVFTQYNAEEFVNELHRQWEARNPEADRSVMQPDSVFVSYASEDRPRVQPIVSMLEERGIRVWFDRKNLTSGEPWALSIDQNIRQAAAFIPVLSETTSRATDREFIAEWKQAIDRAGKMAQDDRFLFPLAIDSVDPDGPSIFPAFRAVNWVRVNDSTFPEDLVKHLNDAIRRKKVGARR